MQNKEAKVKHGCRPVEICHKCLHVWYTVEIIKVVVVTWFITHLSLFTEQLHLCTVQHQMLQYKDSTSPGKP